MLRALTETNKKTPQNVRTDGECKQRVEIVRKSKIEVLKTKNTVTEMNNALMTNRLDMAEEGISELEDMIKEMSKTETQREKKTKKKKTEQNIPEMQL